VSQGAVRNFSSKSSTFPWYIIIFPTFPTFSDIFSIFNDSKSSQDTGQIMQAMELLKTGWEFLDIRRSEEARALKCRISKGKGGNHGPAEIFGIKVS